MYTYIAVDKYDIKVYCIILRVLSRTLVTIMVQRKERADELVFLQGLAESREQAKRLIMAGKVIVNNGIDHGNTLRVDKPGHKYPIGTIFMLTSKERFVSRGGYKLLTALEFFQIKVQNFICLDAGASTGGFTDCLLQHGAKKVYAVDVGREQLHERLYNDDRVISLDKINLRIASKELLPELVDFIVVDVSFISLTKVLPSCIRWLKLSGTIVALVKPQFEVWPHRTTKGVVKDSMLQKEAVNKIITFCQEKLNVMYLGVVPASIKGPKGNQEYLIYLKKL